LPGAPKATLSATNGRSHKPAMPMFAGLCHHLPGFPVLDVNQINCLPPAGILPAIVPRRAKEFGFFRNLPRAESANQ